MFEAKMLESQQHRRILKKRDQRQRIVPDDDDEEEVEEERVIIEPEQEGEHSEPQDDIDGMSRIRHGILARQFGALG